MCSSVGRNPLKINLHVWFYVIIFLTILYNTCKTGHIKSSVLLSLFVGAGRAASLARRAYLTALSSISGHTREMDSILQWTTSTVILKELYSIEMCAICLDTFERFYN